MKNKLVEMSHNVCYCEANFQFHLGDLVWYRHNLFVVYGIDVTTGFVPLYIIRNENGEQFTELASHLDPYFKVGQHVDVGVKDSAGRTLYCVVRKIKGSRYFVYCDVNDFGFWVDAKELHPATNWVY